LSFCTEGTIVKNLLGWLGLMAVLVGGVMPGMAVARAAHVDSAFGDELIGKLGYPLVEIYAGPGGVDAPDWLAPGPVHVRLSIADGYIGYVNIVRPPDGLDPLLEQPQMMLAGAHDLAQAGWTYFGGTNTPAPGETASFLISLAPGAYRIAASYYSAGDPSDEVMTLSSLTVGGGSTPLPTPADMAGPAADVTLTMTDDLRYVITPDAVPSGPHIWKLENTGTRHAHHVVLFRVPAGYSDEEIVAEYQKLKDGESPAAGSFVSQVSWAGYAAMQSAGTVTWMEFDFEPGTYAAICFILDPDTELPHVLDGMVTQFVVR
jgi:hypothetical protein